MTHNVSHGRGGAANIRPDDTVYADGGIVREGVVGDQGDGPFSSGRGGAGNVLGQPKAVVAGHPHDDEIIPETATRLTQEQSHHVGRGGAGNEHHVHKEKEKKKVSQYGFEKDVPHESLLDKAKHLLHGKKDGE